MSPTTYAAKQATFDEERAAARLRNAAARKRAGADGRIARERRTGRATITWLPVPVSPGSRTLVHGVASDASGATKERYL